MKGFNICKLVKMIERDLACDLGYEETTLTDIEGIVKGFKTVIESEDGDKYIISLHITTDYIRVFAEEEDDFFNVGLVMISLEEFFDHMIELDLTLRQGLMALYVEAIQKLILRKERY